MAVSLGCKSTNTEGWKYAKKQINIQTMLQQPERWKYTSFDFGISWPTIEKILKYVLHFYYSM